MTVRPAVVADVPAIVALIQHHAAQGKMVPRPADEIYTQLRSYWVAEADDAPGLAGCASSHLYWSDLAELKGLAVAAGWEGRGVGRALCLACHDELRRLGVRRVFALTGTPRFFERLGYRIGDKKELPRFIWGECVRCPSFPVCQEEALVLDLLPS
ncbi:MAG TPA: N-acetyltransferase [Gemmatales bacterium]|nr:N-acetyltransferase [Gemmatales bacterium]